MYAIRKSFAIPIIIFIVLTVLISSTLAEINWAAMTNEEIENELLAGKKELLSRSGKALEMGIPFIIENEYGSYSITLEDSHILNDSSWTMFTKEKGDECIAISIQGICENIDAHEYGKYDYISNYRISKDLIVTDQEGFSLEFLDVSGLNDGRYEVAAKTIVGTKKRISLTYYAYTDTTSIKISAPGYNEVVEIKLH